MLNKIATIQADGTLFVISGPSGAGKTSLIDKVRAEVLGLGLELHFSVSHTTREARAGEHEGVNYYYVSRETFDGMARAGEFLEFAHVHGQMYGTSKLEVEARLDRGEDVIIDIDVQGARQISENEKLKHRSVKVFVFPPSFDELEKRIRRRGLNTEDQIEMRLRKASAEIDDGCSFYDYVVINDQFEVAVEYLKAAVVATKLQSKAALESLQEMARKFKEEHSGRIARGS